MAQERIDDLMQYAKDIAKAERELKIEHWVYITFEIRDGSRNREVLHEIDIPREMLDRWRWLIEWRRAKLVCKYPRKKIVVYHCYYDKRTGLQTGMNFILSKVASAKAQITRVERIIAQYIKDETQNNLFFNPGTDEQLLKANTKLEQKKKNYSEAYAVLQAEVFYDISHLTTGQLREMFTSYREIGWIDYEYEVLDEDNPPIQPLSDAEIILNIQADNERNYFVFMLGHEDEEDGVMIGFGLAYHEDFSAYLHLAPKYLKELIGKYALVSKGTNVENMTVEQYLIAQAKNLSMN